MSARIDDGVGFRTLIVSAPFMMDWTPPFVTSPVILVHNASHALYPGRLTRRWPHAGALIAQLKLDDFESGLVALRLGLTVQVCVWHARACTPCMYTHVHPADPCMLGLTVQVSTRQHPLPLAPCRRPF